MAICGGCSKPVNQGEKARKIQPLGAIKKINPTANAACGTASNHPSLRTRAAHQGLPKACEMSQAVRPHASSVEAKPVHIVIRIAELMLGASNSAFHASKLPIAGIEYAQTAIKREATGKASVALASIGFTPRNGAAILSQSGRPNCHVARGSRVRIFRLDHWRGQH